MQVDIVEREEFIVVGVRLVGEMGAQDVGPLWREAFLPRRDELTRANRRYYGVFNVIPDENKGGRFEYVAGAEGTMEDIPLGMVGWLVPAGKYAEATAVGLSGVNQAGRDVVTEWLPDSGYRLVPSPIFAHTEDPEPDSPKAVWTIDIPVETPEILEQLEKWKI